MNKKEDRRIERTRSMLFDALLDLMIERGYEGLTVQDIIDRANIGRSTFYSHFSDKEQLLVGNIDRLHVFLKELIAKRPLHKEQDPFRFDFSLVMLQHVQSHKRLYHWTVGQKGETLVLHHMRKMVSKLVDEEVMLYLSKYESLHIPRDVITEFVVTTFLTVLTWWLERNIHSSAEECDRLFHKLTLSGISAYD